MSDMKTIRVIGSGVIGLSTACVLAEHGGFEVDVVSDLDPQLTTSSKAAAFWEPYHVEGARPEWGRDTYDHLNKLRHVAEAGITRTDVRRYFGSPVERIEWEAANTWCKVIPELNYTVTLGRGVLHGFHAMAGYTVPVVHMPMYLAYLKSRALAAGVRFAFRRISKISDELPDVDGLINCTGLGSRKLTDVRDARLYACRGQVVILDPHPAISTLTFITTGQDYEKSNRPLYIVPRGRIDIVCGGTTDDHAEDERPVSSITQSIIRRCTVHHPEIAALTIRDVRVGLRPARSPVRIVKDDTGVFERPVIHNYGHGGAGVSLSWGSALEVLRHLVSVSDRVRNELV